MQKKRILVAPLNWGLGHATRCIPLIKELIDQDFEPILASDGAALDLLKKEFPSLKAHHLPPYNISYSRSPALFSLKLLIQTPHILRCVAEEKKITASLVQSERLDGIISDNRWGVRSSRVPSVFITHQLKVYSGITTSLTTYIQQWYIKKFDECWVPDNPEPPFLSGTMGHIKNLPFPVKYLGILSRFKKETRPLSYDITVLLSGPEPQRGMLEAKLETELAQTNLKILFIKGIVEEKQLWQVKGKMTRVNFLTSGQLNDALNSSDLVICRPGYTSLMDLAQLEKKAFFIPTPGQPEQNYLAKKMQEEKRAPYCKQEDFSFKELEVMKNYGNLSGLTSPIGFSGIFTLFKGE